MRALTRLAVVGVFLSLALAAALLVRPETTRDPQGRLAVPKGRAFTDFAVPRLKKHFAQLKKSLGAR